MNVFTIETDRLILRPFKLSDAESYFNMTRDEDIQEYVPYACQNSIAETREDIEKYYSKGDFIHDYYLVIESKEIHQMVGALIVTEDQKWEFEICIMIAKEHRRKGYITEATVALMKAMPTESILRWTIRRDNIASLQSVAKLQNVYEVKAEAGIEETGEFRIFKATV